MKIALDNGDTIEMTATHVTLTGKCADGVHRIKWSVPIGLDNHSSTLAALMRHIQGKKK